MELRWLILGCLLLLASTTYAQEEEEGTGDEEAEAEATGEEDSDPEAEAEGTGDSDAEAEEEGDDGEAEGTPDDDGEDELEECEEVEDSEGSANGTDDIGAILALGGEKKCKPKGEDDGSGEVELSGADALAAELPQECDKEGMDEKVAECLGGLESQVSDLMNAIMGPDGEDGGSLEDKITLVLVKKGVISCENETQCDDNKQCLDQHDGMHRCQNPCERPEIIRCDVPYSECVTEEHQPSCICKEEFHGNGTDVCIPNGFNTEENKRGYRMFDEEYVEWDNATDKCADLGARLPVLSDAKTINIVKNYLAQANFSVFEQWDRSSRRVWLGLQYDRGSGLVWVDGS